MVPIQVNWLPQAKQSWRRSSPFSDAFPLKGRLLLPDLKNFLPPHPREPRLKISFPFYQPSALLPPRLIPLPLRQRCSFPPDVVCPLPFLFPREVLPKTSLSQSEGSRSDFPSNHRENHQMGLPCLSLRINNFYVLVLPDAG